MRDDKDPSFFLTQLKKQYKKNCFACKIENCCHQIFTVPAYLKDSHKLGEMVFDYNTVNPQKANMCQDVTNEMRKHAEQDHRQSRDTFPTFFRFKNSKRIIKPADDFVEDSEEEESDGDCNTSTEDDEESEDAEASSLVRL